VVEWINDNIRQIVLALNGKLSFGDNIASDLRDITISSSRAEIISSRVARPIGIWPVWSEAGILPLISWAQTPSGIQVSVVGVTQPTKIRFLLLGS
jgi:hypothetical protein